MKWYKLFAVCLFAFITGLMPLTAQGLTFSGLLDSTVSMQAGAEDSPAFSYGVEEYANVRMQARVKDRAVFYGAVNFIAAAGDTAADAAILAGMTAVTPGFAPSALTAGQNYTAGFELERLYFRLNGDAVDFDGGLLRLPFGYGQIWGPSDFLNPKNPLLPDARPRAVLGAGLSWYPVDSLKLLGFGAGPKDPFGQSGEGGLVGLSMDKHWDKVSLQVLYGFESPKEQSSRGIHLMGMSVKADVEISLMADILYAYNNEAGTKIDGLSASAGFDYSFFKGKLITLVEYLYNGNTSSTSRAGGGSWSEEHYLYSGLTSLVSDYTSISLALIAAFNDISFTPILSAEHELFQGCSLIFTIHVPLDRDLFTGDGNRGELGPVPPDELQPLLPADGKRMGSYCNFSAKLRLRF